MGRFIDGLTNEIQCSEQIFDALCLENKTNRIEKMET